MKTVARKLSFAASPLVLAVALGLLAPNVLLDDEGDSARADGATSPEATASLDAADADDDRA